VMRQAPFCNSVSRGEGKCVSTGAVVTGASFATGLNRTRSDLQKK
jgi:hypothetical protein